MAEDELDPERSAELAHGLDRDVLDAYLAHECSPGQLAQIDSWLAGGTGRRALLEGLRRGVRESETYPPLPSADRARARIECVARSSSQSSGALPRAATWQRRQQDSHKHWRWILPAIVAVAIVGGAIVLPRARSAATNGDGQRTAHAVTEYVTRAGQRAELHLSDGTRVVLNVASKLRVPTDFGRSSRTVVLEGQAMFTVAQRSEAPFRVVAGSATTSVLGTEFTVRRYSSEPLTVAVRDGRVSVRDSARYPFHNPIRQPDDASRSRPASSERTVLANAVLTAGEQGTLRSGAIVVQHAPRAIFAFADGTLTFDAVPLRDAIPDLERWFDVHIIVDSGELLQKRVDASFAHESPAELATLLEMTFQTRVTRAGDTITLTGKPL